MSDGPILTTRTAAPEGAMRLRVEEGRVLLIVDGRLVARLPWQAADAVANALKSKAREAEAWCSREALVKGEAAMLRLGLPFHLSGDPAVVRAAWQESQHDPTLRRYLPNAPGPNVASPKEVHPPSVIKSEG